MSETEDFGHVFLERSKYIPGKIPHRQLDPALRPAAYKVYPNAPRIHLPPMTQFNGEPLHVLMNRRRSRRGFRPDPITGSQVAALLWSVAGITGDAGGIKLRTVPSAGARYAIETYLSVQRVADVPPGLYHYHVQDAQLEKLADGFQGAAIASAFLNQQMGTSAAVTFLFTAVIDRAAWKYGQRAYRYIYLDAGHVGQSLMLAAEAMHLGCCNIGAFYDDECNHLLGVDGIKETTVYCAAVGRV